MSGDISDLASAELRAAGEGWARAAELLDRRADALAAGLPALERAWESAAGQAYTDSVRALVARMRAVADVARYNHAQVRAAADATDDAARQLALVSEPAERDAVARTLMEELNETYANVAARLTGPTGPTADVGHAPPSVSLSASLSEALSASLSASLEGQARAGAGDVSEDPTPNDDADAPGADVDLDLPDVAEPVSLPPGASYATRTAGRAERFPTTPRHGVAPVLPRASSGPSEAPVAVPRPRTGGKRAAEESYVDARGHHVRIRWRGDDPAEPSRDQEP